MRKTTRVPSNRELDMTLDVILRGQDLIRHDVRFLKLLNNLDADSFMNLYSRVHGLEKAQKEQDAKLNRILELLGEKVTDRTDDEEGVDNL